MENRNSHKTRTEQISSLVHRILTSVGEGAGSDEAGRLLLVFIMEQTQCRRLDLAMFNFQSTKF